MNQSNKGLSRQAKAVLEKNWTGYFTKPSPKLYPHQWSWDSAFIAIGYARYYQEQAQQEIRHLFESIWTNGLIPHIVFDPDAAGYFPGFPFWQSDRSPFAPTHRLTSGIVQPPVHATAVRMVYEHAQDRTAAHSFLMDIFPSLKAWHRYLYRERDPAGEGLVYIRHPWESGMDNAPAWDDILMRMHLSQDQLPAYRRVDADIVAANERPTHAEYDRYAYLVQFFKERDYDESEIRKDCPFLVQDVLFNTLLCRSGHDMVALASVLGEDPAPFEHQARRTAEMMNKKLWDNERHLYLNYNIADGRSIPAHMATCYAPLFAGIPGPERAEFMVECLERFGFLGDEKVLYPVPSYDPNGLGFSPVRYWRGPAWININWLLMRGLSQYGYIDFAERVRDGIVTLIRQEGFYEYYNPLTGKGHGAEGFSWTAALLLDVLYDNSVGIDGIDNRV